jgi:hypothetical protein
MVVLYLAGGNRDPDAYDANPYGQGRAPGLLRRHPLLPRAPRARLEATMALQRLVQRFPRLQRAGRLKRCSGNVIRGPAELVVGPVSHGQRDAPAPGWRGATRRDLDAETWGQRLTMY